MTCRYDRAADAHLRREHRPDCIDRHCGGCEPCTHDDHGNPVRHCRVRRRCTSHLAHGEYACPGCLKKIRDNLSSILDLHAAMPTEALWQGIESEAANLAGPHADWVTAQWRNLNAERNGEKEVDMLDARDPYTCLTGYECTIREDLGHDEYTLVSPHLAGASAYLEWVLTDLARDEEQQPQLIALMSDTAALREHLNATLRNSRTPERGIPCPECVDAGLDAPRLVRRYGHWCTREDCTKKHYLDTSGDAWRCPDNHRHEWTHKAYEERLSERRRVS